MMRIPKKISPCPIIEAMVELRFEPSLPEEAVFGVVYSVVRDDFPEVRQLHILNLPLEIRNQDPNLTYKPTHKMVQGNNILQVGPRVITFSRVDKYNGWDEFSRDINNITQKLLGLKIAKSYMGFSLRYINKFDFDIWDNLDLKVVLGDRKFETLLTHVRADVADGDFIHLLQVANNVSFGKEGEKAQQQDAAIIDIATAYKGDMSIFADNPGEILNRAHDKEKGLFFSLLKGQYINQLQPEY